MHNVALYFKITTKSQFGMHLNLSQLIEKVNRKVQEEPQAEAADNPRHQEAHRLTCA